MGSWQVIPVGSKLAPVRLVSEGDGTTLIANIDIVNPVFVSDDPGMYASQQNAIQINPQSYLIVDGNTNLYALAASGHTVNVNVIPGAMSFFQSTITGTGFLVTNKGFFFYNGTPGVGNLIASIVAPGVTSDPFGNPVVNVLNVGNTAGAFMQVDAAGEILLFNGAGAEVIQISPINQGVFIYTSAGAGLGTLASSDVPSDFIGNDAFGNAVLPGKTEYKKITSADWQALQMNSGALNWWTATAPGGPWTLNFTIALQPDEVGLSMASNVSGNSITVGETAAALQVFGGGNILTGNFNWQAGATGDRLTISKSANMPLLTVTDTLAGATGALIAAQVQQVGDNYMRCHVAGDVNSRFGIDWNGPTSTTRLHMGNGVNAIDTVLYRNSAALWGSSPLAFDNAGSIEVDQTPTMANGWLQTTGRAGIVFRRCVTNDILEWIGAVTVPAGFAANQNITTAVGTAWRPANTQSITGWDTSNNNPVRFAVLSTGPLQFIGPAANTAAGHNIDIPCQQIRLTD